MPSQPDESIEFFVDRSLGSRLVPEAVRDAGFVVHTAESLYGSREDEFLEDSDWLRDVGIRGLVVLMKDKRIRYRPHEIQAVSEASVKAFCLTSGNLRGYEQAQRIIDNLPRIVRAAEHDGPFIYGVRAHEIEKIWSPTEQSG